MRQSKAESWESIIEIRTKIRHCELMFETHSFRFFSSKTEIAHYVPKFQAYGSFDRIRSETSDVDEIRRRSILYEDVRPICRTQGVI